MNTLVHDHTNQWHRVNRWRLRSAILILLLLVPACSNASGDSTAVPDEPDGVFLDASEFETYSTLEELVRASAVVMEGEVISVVPGRINAVPELEDFAGTQILEVTIATLNQLAGDPVDTAVIEWMGWEIGDDGEPGPPFLVEGMPPPRVGDRAIWFLRTRSDPPPGSKATFSIASLDGRLDISADATVTTRIAGGNRLANRLSGTSVDDIKSAVRGALIP